MKILECILAICLITPLSSFAAGNIEVPFSNIELASAQKITARYNFDAQHQTLVCYANGNSVAHGYAEWKYKDTTNAVGIGPGSSLHLKGHLYPKGFYADTKGDLNFANQSASPLYLSCEYHTWN